jgi:hypothetical protein
MLMALSGHMSVQSLAKYVRVSAKALQRHQAERDSPRADVRGTISWPATEMAPVPASDAYASWFDTIYRVFDRPAEDPTALHPG